MCFFFGFSDLNAQQVEAFHRAMEGHSFIVQGAAGTGKTHTISAIAERLGKRKRVACTASTGLAARQFVNRTAKNATPLTSTTIHSWAGLRDGRYSISEQSAIILDDCNAHIRQKIIDTDVLIISEVSMISAAIFDRLEVSCRVARGNQLLFGGLQLILEGDMVQLPPVVKPRYGDPGSLIFDSKAFRQAVPHMVKLTKVVRQTDMNFINIIQEVSWGIASKETEAWLQSMSRPLPPDMSRIHLFYLRDDTAAHNSRYVELDPSLVGPPKVYSARDTADPHGALKRCVAPTKLKLRQGCPVVLVKNICTHGTKQLVNGLRLVMM